MKFSAKNLLLVVPLYNHGATVATVVSKAIASGYPVLVVDDGSIDDGASQLTGLNCHLLQFPENRGKGAALLAAFEYAEKIGFQAIVTIDADGQHNPEDVPMLVADAESGGWPAIVIGDREMIQDSVPNSSHFGKKFSNFWVKLETGSELTDTQSGLRLYPVSEVQKLNLKQLRYDFEIEILVKAIWGGVTVRSVAVSVHYPDPQERVSHFHKVYDNCRLSLLHSRLVCRRLLPFPHKRVVAEPPKKEHLQHIAHPIAALRELCRENASPFWLAVAVWCGLFLGTLPLIACHTVVIIYVSCRLHLNKVAAVAASQFCMPPVVPALCIEVGYYLRNGTFLYDLSWQRWLLEIPQRVWEWFLGSLVLGPLFGLLGGAVVYFASKFLRQKKRDEGTIKPTL